jgi:hypothetical protein
MKNGTPEKFGSLRSPVLPELLERPPPVVSTAANYSRSREEVIEQRVRGLYQIDRNQPIRKSHENPFIQQLYQEFLGEPGSSRSHELLHVHVTEETHLA